ncbi:6-phosphogluconate phosphatase [Alphaproteobacteria bacterium SO-S41]|nr:6-phosphogluconate phosphatase [Alphaproteobacteria bacterium SO-S41]
MFEAVIFDCDGVLVDNEVVLHAIELEVLAEIGLAYEPAVFKARFMGLNDAAFFAGLEADAMARLGRSVVAEIKPVMEERYAVRRDLIGEVRGAAAAVAALGGRAKAVASSSGVASLERKLRRIALWAPFAPHVYSADLVAEAKPAPDLFLFTAEQLGVAPARCLVIEDSVNGVRAGIAAGMTVWGFAGGGHMNDGMAARLSEAGAARVIADWTEGADLLGALQP